MQTPQLTIAVVSKDVEQSCAFSTLHTRMAMVVARVVNAHGESLAAIGNRFLDAAATPVFGLLHADVYLGAGALETFTAMAANGFVTGIVGIDLDRHYRWCHNTELQVQSDGAIEDVPGPVSTLDSCSVFFRRDSGLRFDEQTFDGFHCHVEDLCLEAHARGIPVVVPPAEATHSGLSTFDSSWQAQNRIYRQRLKRKWSGVPFQCV
jgi:hypothetical protein